MEQKTVDTKAILERYAQKKIDYAGLLRELAPAEFFFSTYNKDYDHDNMLPVFLTKEDAIEYYDKAGRKDALIIKKPFDHIVKSNISLHGKRFEADKGLIIDPEKYNLVISPDSLLNAEWIILRETDHFIHFKKTYLLAAICLTVLILCFIGCIIACRSIINEMQTDCQTASASVIEVDTKKNRITVSAMGQLYDIKGISNGNIWSYSSARITGKQIKVFIKDGKAYTDYFSLKYNTTVYGKITNFSYVAVAVLLILTGTVYGSYFEARKREKRLDKLINEDVIKMDEKPSA